MTKKQPKSKKAKSFMPRFSVEMLQILLALSCLFCASAYLSHASKSFSTSLNFFSFGKPSAPPQPKSLASKEEFDAAFGYWKESYGNVAPTSKNYLSEADFRKKLDAVIKSVGKGEDVVQMMKNDVSFFAYRTERIAESFQAWSTKLKSRDEAAKLCIRNPPILSIQPNYIDQADPGTIAQTYFWSYVAVALRPLSTGVQRAIRGN